MFKYRKFYLAGLTGFIALFLFYFTVMRFLAGSWEAAVSQFYKLWYYMIPLSFGFGIQVGLYSYLRKLIKNNSGKRVMMTNTTTSAIGMVTCCAHHLTDVLPLAGLTVFSTLLVTFQTPILLVGIISNCLGIYFLVQKIKTIGKNTKK